MLLETCIFDFSKIEILETKQQCWYRYALCGNESVAVQQTNFNNFYRTLQIDEGGSQLYEMVAKNERSSKPPSSSFLYAAYLIICC